MMVNDTVKTTCPYCGVVCGVLAKPKDDGAEIAGDPDHPANFGRLCVKGAPGGGWDQGARRHAPDGGAFSLSGQ